MPVGEKTKLLWQNPEYRLKMNSHKFGNKNRLGKKHSEETKKKLKKAIFQSPMYKYWLGKKMSDEAKKNNSTAQKGKKMSIESRKKIGDASRGEKNWRWKGGITPENMRIRKSIEIKLWREAVFVRDNWTCQRCFKKGGILQADHIKRFSEYPELRFAIDNGRTLCKECHRRTDTWGSKGLKNRRYKNKI